MSRAGQTAIRERPTESVRAGAERPFRTGRSPVPRVPVARSALRMTATRSRMLPTDAFAWHMEERDPALRSTVVTVMRLAGAPDWTRLRRRMDRVSRHIPRLRQRVQESQWPWRPLNWVSDDAFDLDFHLVHE